MAPATFWTDWPLSLRQSPPGGPASEMNEAFFEDFARRDENLRTRIIPGDNLSATIFEPDLGDWTPIGASSRIWIPRWAEYLVIRCSMAAQELGPDGDISASARPRIGLVYAPEMTIFTESSFGPDLINTESVFLIPNSMRDTEQDFTYEVRRNSLRTEYVRIFNDARDATDGHRHRHWLLLEAA